MKLNSWVALSLVTALILITTDSSAKVVDPKIDKDLSIRLEGTEYIHWFLIEELTLKNLYKDAKLYKITYDDLVKAQHDLDLTTDKLNKSAKLINKLNLVNNQLKLDIFNYEHPPWYKNYIVWGAVGLALGSAVTILALSIGGSIGN